MSSDDALFTGNSCHVILKYIQVRGSVHRQQTLFRFDAGTWERSCLSQRAEKLFSANVPPRARTVWMSHINTHGCHTADGHTHCSFYKYFRWPVVAVIVDSGHQYLFLTRSSATWKWKNLYRFKHIVFASRVAANSNSKSLSIHLKVWNINYLFICLNYYYYSHFGGGCVKWEDGSVATILLLLLLLLLSDGRMIWCDAFDCIYLRSSSFLCRFTISIQFGQRVHLESLLLPILYVGSTLLFGFLSWIIKCFSVRAHTHTHSSYLCMSVVCRVTRMAMVDVIVCLSSLRRPYELFARLFVCCYLWKRMRHHLLYFFSVKGERILLFWRARDSRMHRPQSLRRMYKCILSGRFCIVCETRGE